MEYLRKTYHDTMYDYTERLHKDYDRLPVDWLNYFVLRLGNMITKSMRWKNVYRTEYDHEKEMITVSGFPPYEIRKDLNVFDNVLVGDIECFHRKYGKKWRYNDVSVPQVDYVVHKLNYAQAIVYFYKKDLLKIEFYREKIEMDANCVVIKFLKYAEEETDIDGTNCNILTPVEEEHHCPHCHCECHREEGTGDGEP